MSDAVTKLAFAVLLSAAKKSPEAFRIRPDGIDHVVEHRVGEQTVEEMRAPRAVLAAVVRRLAVMANLAAYEAGESASGLIHLEVGTDRTLYFAVLVRGEGDGLVLDGRVISEPEYLAGG